MRTPVCDLLGIDVPVFAFSHCRDVVAAVSKAGGFGVLGAAYFNAEQLATQLNRLDAQPGDETYGVDIMLPQGEDPSAARDAAVLTRRLRQRIPTEHRNFINGLLKAHDVPEWPDPSDEAGLLGWTAATVMPLLDISLTHPICRLIANALGAPPKHLVDRIHASGRLVAGLCGRVGHAAKHQQAGLDLLVAVSSEGGGHVGEVGSVVLWPQVVADGG